jgi:cell division ATPase FtsA
MAEQALNVPVRNGSPQGLETMGETLPDPAFAAAVGLILHGNRVRLMRGPSEKGIVGKIWEVLRGRN